MRLPEFEDQPWFPDSIRRSMTDYLRYLFNRLDLYNPVCPLLLQGLRATHEQNILDLCSGSGGGIQKVGEEVQRSTGNPVPIILSDKFPNVEAFKWLQKNSQGNISYIPTAVDATAVPSELKGFRTIFSGFHHFDDKKAREVLRDCVKAKRGIGIFDGGDKNIAILLAIILIHPILFFLFTPFFRPFRLSRILFTYLIPVIPFCTVWDGIASILKLYTPDKMLQMAREAGPEYEWISGKKRNRYGLKIAYLCGWPKVD